MRENAATKATRLLTEGRVTINRLFDRTADIAVSEAAHGSAGDRRYEYLPTYFLRGLINLHLEFTPTGA